MHVEMYMDENDDESCIRYTYIMWYLYYVKENDILNMLIKT